MPCIEPLQIGGVTIEAGQTTDVTLKISEHYCGTPIGLPLHVIRGAAAGPCVFITGAVHGDEINGTGIIRELIVNQPPKLLKGTLILLPVVNMLGFERHSRYMPDRRDLNRSFPGSASGSLASRLAHAVFEKVVRYCDYGIDLHTAADFRTTIPNIRVDPNNPLAMQIAMAFGCELVILYPGPAASLRRAACAVGCSTILLEAGQAWRIEPDVVKFGSQSIRRVLIELGMTTGVSVRPSRQWLIRKRVWLRASKSGLLQFHANLGEMIQPGQTIATNASLLGRRRSVLRSHVRGLLMGMTTRPSVKPGDPVCHIAIIDDDEDPK